MIIKMYENYELISKKVAEYIIDTIKKKPKSLLCLAGGDTPLRTYEYLVEAYKNNEVDFTKCKFVGLDEWVGLSKETKGSCIEMLNENLYSKLDLKDHQICYFNGLADDLENECKRVDKFIFDNDGIDLILLGVGMNGHLGFNEPNIDPNLYCNIVNLDEVTRNVGLKYFHEKIDLRQGITLGMKHILNSKIKIIMANGEKKADIIKKIIEGEKTIEVPASLLVDEKSVSIFLDREASSKLKNKLKYEKGIRIWLK